jgi:hypothetical protein
MRHQVKSQWYYVFWAIMAAAVVGGQLYSGYNHAKLSRELRSFSQALYDTEMGWDARQQELEKRANDPLKSNRTYQFE